MKTRSHEGENVFLNKGKQPIQSVFTGALNVGLYTCIHYTLSFFLWFWLSTHLTVLFRNGVPAPLGKLITSSAAASWGTLITSTPPALHNRFLFLLSLPKCLERTLMGNCEKLISTNSATPHNLLQMMLST